MLVGREPERELLTALLERARAGEAGALVIRGEPGVGKSALVRELEPGDATVLAVQGVEAESPLPYAALHRLLRPAGRWRESLAPVQATALAQALGEAAGGPVEPFLVGVATLSLLTTAAEEAPVLCLVDDAHWLDPATSDALLFCARRLGADRVAMVFAAREGEWDGFDPVGVPEITLGGLPDAARHALLDTVLEASADAGVRARLAEESGGNPLALLELPAELTAAQLRGDASMPSTLHLTVRLERAFLDRSRRLAEPAQLMLLLAACDDTGDPGVLHRAGAALGAGSADYDAVIASGLLVAHGDVVRVRHPLVRSAVSQAASDADRRRAHDALAVALAAHGDPDRAIWHRAAGLDGADPAVVDGLAEVAARAQLRGAYASSLAAYERAAALCADPERRAGLLLAAARNAWACGRASRARTLISDARHLSDDPLLVCDLARLRGHIEVNIGSAVAAHRIFVEAARAVLPHDPDRALEIAVAAAVMRTFGADSGTAPPEGLAAELVGDSTRARCLRALLGAMTRVSDGDWEAAVPLLDGALAAGESVDDRDVLWNLANAALQLGDDAAQQRFYERALSRAREAGAITAVIYCLQRLCFGAYLAGDVGAVRASAQEAITLSASIGQPGLAALPTAWLAVLAAFQGGQDALALIEEAALLAEAHPLGILADPAHDLEHWARALLATSAGDSSAAAHHLAQLRLPVLARMTAALRIEASVHAGDTATAVACTAELAEFAAATGRPWASAAAALGHALTSEDADAETHFRVSIAEYDRARRPIDAARARLAYGEWLRRAQRRVDAREHLRAAAATFRDTRAEPLTARAERELRASGETARKRDPSTVVALTPTELQIARLVRSGMSNKEVAAECWVSPRTVAFHLRNVFAKAGITSRGELARLDLT